MLLGFGVINHAAFRFEFKDWAATDLLHGESIFIVGFILLSLAIVDPHRAQSTAAAALHSLALGIIIWWVKFFTLNADLYNRNDRLFLVLVAITLSVPLARWILAPILIFAVSLCSLKRDPRGGSVLRVARTLMLTRQQNSQTDRSPTSGLFWHFVQLYSRHRGWLGFAQTRSYAIELALQRSVDKRTAVLRRSCRPGANGGKLVSAANSTGHAMAAELEMVSIVAEFGVSINAEGHPWLHRFLTAWDLLRHAERQAGGRIDRARHSMLEMLERVAPGQSLLARAAHGRRLNEFSMSLLEQIQRLNRPSASELDLVAVLLLTDLLVEIERAQWALSLLESAIVVNASGTFQPSIQRIRHEAEAQMLRHESALDSADSAIRRSRHDRGMLLADAPEVEVTRESLIPSLRNVKPKNSRRSTRRLEGLRRPGFDKTACKTCLVGAVALMGVCLALYYTAQVPLGNAFKPLLHLHRKDSPNAHAITAAEMDPTDQTLLMTTMGGGLHRVKPTTFRLRRTTPESGGPSSPWLSDLAVSSNGQIAVVTEACSPETNRITASGLDVQIAGQWHTLIGTNAVHPVDPSDIRFVLPLENDKLLITPARIIFYSSARRELREVRRFSDNAITAAAASADDARQIWLAFSNGAGKDAQIASLIFDRQGSYRTSEIHPFDQRVEEIACSPGVVLARTEASNLYQRSSTGWRFWLDGDTALNLNRVRHVILSPGSPPALWMTELDSNGDVQAVRSRVIPEKGVLPPGPWRRLAFSSDSSPTNSSIPLASHLRLSAQDAPPAPWFDSQRKIHHLYVAGVNGGMWRLSTDIENPRSAKQATISTAFIGTPGERVLSIDIMSSNMVVLLESLDHSYRHLGLSELPTETGRVLLHSFLPDQQNLQGTSILAARQNDETKQLHLVLSNGRMLTYDLRLHGLMSGAGAILVDSNDHPIDALRTADLTEAGMVIVDQQGRVFKDDPRVHSRNDEARIALNLVHQAPRHKPSSALEPLRIASEPAGVEVFFGTPGTGVAWPWLVNDRRKTSGPISDQQRISLLEWNPPTIVHPLQIGTVTRLQWNGSVGSLIALDEKGSLLWRGSNGWSDVEAGDGAWSKLFVAAGGDFLLGNEGLFRVAAKQERPVIGQKLWETQTNVLELPVYGVAGLAQEDDAVIVVHAGGFAQYSPTRRNWKSLLRYPNENRPNPEFTSWGLLGIENSNGLSTNLWALRRYRNEMLQIFGVNRAGLHELDIRGISQAAAAGANLGLLLNSGAFVVAEPSGRITQIEAGISTDVGNGRFVRLAAGDTLYGVDERGRLLIAQTNTLRWSVTPQQKPIKDLALAGNGSLFLLTTDNEVFLRQPTGLFTELEKTGETLETVNHYVTTAAPSSGRLEIFRPDGNYSGIAAGGIDPDARLGNQPTAALCDGDTLYLAGPAGAVARVPQQVRCVPIQNSRKIDFFEKQGRHIIAWKSGVPALLEPREGEREFRSLSSGIADVLLSPEDELWISAGETGGKYIIPSAGANHDRRLFNREVELSAPIADAAPFDEHRILLQGLARDVVEYDTQTRSLRRLAHGSAYPWGWSFVRLGGRLFLRAKSNNPQVNSIVRVSGNSPGLEPMEESAFSTLHFSGGLAWISADGVVHQINTVGDHQILTEPCELQRRNESGAELEQVLKLGDDTIWGLAGGTAFKYSISSSKVVARHTQVQSLFKAGDMVVGLKNNPNGTKSVVPLENASWPEREFQMLKPGENEVIGWLTRGDFRLVTHIGRQFKEWQQAVIPSVPLRNASMTSLDGQTLYLLGSQGQILSYDMTQGRWDPILATEAGWHQLGVVGNSVAALRAANDVSQVVFLTPSAGVARQTQIRGQAWFTRDAVVVIDQQPPAVTRISLDPGAGETTTLASFAPALPRFIPERTAVFENTNTMASLLVLQEATSAEMKSYLVHTNGRAQALSGVHLTGFAEKLSVCAESNEFVVVDSSSRLLRIDRLSGLVRTSSFEVLAMGMIGSNVWYLNKSEGTNSFVVRRLWDDAKGRDLLSLENQSLLDRVQEAVFHKSGQEHGLAIKLTPTETKTEPNQETKESPATSNTFYLTATKNALQLRSFSWTNVQPSAAGLVRGRLGQNGSIVVLKRRIDEDGWFASQAIVGFGTGKTQTDRIPLRMRDNTVLIYPIGVTVQPQLHASLKGFSINNGHLRHVESGALLGPPPSGKAPFLCDVWSDIYPVSESEFYTLDSISQIWFWNTSGAAPVRKLLKLDQPSRTPKAIVLPLVYDGAAYIQDAAEQTIGRLQNGQVFSVAQTQTTKTIARRAGKAGPIYWQPSGRAISVSLDASNGNGSVRVGLRFTDNGLNTDQPSGLKALPGEMQPWLDLGTTEPGKHLVCPAIADNGKRLARARIVDVFQPAVAQTPFEVDHFRFVPQKEGWTVEVGGRTIPVLDGAFVIDRIRRSATLKNGTGVDLYLTTGLRGFLVKQEWMSGMHLGEPRLVPIATEPQELRAWRGELHARFGTDWHVLRNEQWLRSQPDWRSSQTSASSNWRFDSLNAKLSWKGDEVPFVNRDSGFALASDVLSANRSAEGSPMVRAIDRTTIAFQSAFGNWYSWREGDLVARRLAESSVPTPPDDKIHLAGYTLPSRSPQQESTYALVQNGAAPIHLPLRFENGRMPHQQIEAIESWGEAGILARLGSNYGFALFGVQRIPNWAARIFPARPPPAQIPSYGIHRGVQLQHEKWLVWSARGNTMELQLAASVTAQRRSSLGTLGENGIPIDDPMFITPLEITDRHLTFRFQAALWKRELTPELASFSEETDASKPMTYVPGIDESRRVSLKKPNTIPIADPLLGSFTADGLFDPARSAAARLRQTGTNAALQLHQPGPWPIDLHIIRRPDGWDTPFNSPTAAIYWNTNLVLLSEDNHTVGVWNGSRELVSISNMTAPLATLWRIKDQAYARSADIRAINRFRLQFSPTGSLIAAKDEPVHPDDPEYTNDCFGLLRTSNGSSFEPVWHGMGESKWNSPTSWIADGLPGTKIDRAFWVSAGSLALQDADGFRHYLVNAERFRSVQRSPTTGAQQVLFRQLGLLRAGDPIVPVTHFDVGTNETGLGFVPAALEEGRNLGSWTLRQRSFNEGVTVAADVQNGKRTTIGDTTASSISHGSLLVEQPQRIFRSNKKALVVLPAGTQSIDKNSSFNVAGDTVRHYLMQPGLRHLRTPSDDEYLVVSNSAEGVHLSADLKMTITPSDAQHYLYLGEKGDWRVYRRDPDGLVVERPIQSSPGVVDVLRGSEIFVGGQMAFDKVRGVTRDPRNGQTLQVFTVRSTENIASENKKPVLTLVNQEKPIRRADPWNYVPLRRVGTPNPSWVIESGTERLILNHPLELQQYGGLRGGQPVGFHVDQRIWIVFPDRVYWVESGARWASVRAAQLRIVR